MNVNINGTEFNSVNIDTGSSDLILPALGLNNYQGPTLIVNQTYGSMIYAGLFGDRSYYQAFGINLPLIISGTTIQTMSNVLAAFIQSVSPSLVFDSMGSNGLMGLAYDTMSKFPPQAISSILRSNKTFQNKIGFHACPYEYLANSWMEFGNVEQYRANCGAGELAWTTSPKKSYYTLNIINIYVNDKSVTLPAAFQTTSSSQWGGNSKAWSILVNYLPITGFRKTNFS